MRKPLGKSRSHYWNNLGRLSVLKNPLLKPLVASYYITTKCNLNCRYCEDFGAKRNPDYEEPSLETAINVLRIIRQGTDNIVFTGGEPLTHPKINEIVFQTRNKLHYRKVSIITNGTLLPKHEAVLPFINRLVVSLDSLKPEKWHQIIGATLQTAREIIGNIKHFASLQPKYKFRMILNCVITPDTLDEIEPLIKFCREHRLLISFSPQAVMNWPSYDLVVSKKYMAVLDLLLQQKNEGAPILGSLAYFKTLKKLIPYNCYPTLAPRIFPNGDLIYPCRPIEKEADSHGGRLNLLEIDSWDLALEELSKEYGPPPRTCLSCFQQCYAEPSLMQTKPLSYLYELIRFPPSRQVSLASYPPG
jgi:MoaA/NifB/PqqE/SkfB family radical SAM enzyme